MTVRDGKVCAIWDIANPDKFTGSPLSQILHARALVGAVSVLGSPRHPRASFL